MTPTVCTVSNFWLIYERLFHPLVPTAMFQRLEDRIRQLCVKALATPQSAELDEILRELKSALAEHTRRLRALAAAYPAVPPLRRRDDIVAPELNGD
jgi:hypothetical protein